MGSTGVVDHGKQFSTSNETVICDDKPNPFDGEPNLGWRRLGREGREVSNFYILFFFFCSHCYFP
jgi:hypothetical protein